MSTQESNVINAAKGWFRKDMREVSFDDLSRSQKTLCCAVADLTVAEVREKATANEYVVIKWPNSHEPQALKRKELGTGRGFEVVWGYGASTAKKALKAYAEVVAKQIVAIARKEPKVDTKRLAKRRGRPCKEASPGDWPE